jgi:hypothetical protein
VKRVETCEDRLCCIEKAPYIDDRIIEHQKRVEALEQTTDKLCRQVSAGGSHLSLEFSKMRRLEQRVLELEQAVEKRS